MQDKAVLSNGFVRDGEYSFELNAIRDSKDFLLEKWYGSDGEFEVKRRIFDSDFVSEKENGFFIKNKIDNKGVLLGVSVDIDGSKAAKENTFLISRLVIDNDADFKKYVINGSLADKETEIFILRQSLELEKNIDRQSAFFVKLCYKLIEAESLERAHELLPYIDYFIENEHELKMIDRGKLKGNGHQQFFSILTAAWHLYIFIGDFDKAYSCIEQIVKGEKPKDFFARINFSKNFSRTLFVYAYVNMLSGSSKAAVSGFDSLYDYVRTVASKFPVKIPSDAQLNDFTDAMRFARFGAATRKFIILNNKVQRGDSLTLSEQLVFKRVEKLKNPKNFLPIVTRIKPSFSMFHENLKKFIKKGAVNVS